MRATLFQVFLLCAASTLLNASVASAADDFSGKYEGAKLSLTLAAGQGGYVGEIRLGQQQFPMRAHTESGRLAGTFASDGNNFDFAATIDGDTLTFVTGGVSHTLKKVVASANPLAQLPHAETAQAGAADLSAGYTVVNSTDFGKTLAVTKPDASSVQKAFEATFPDLARFFGVRPTIQGAYEDVKNHVGGASFTANVNGKLLKGFVSCKVGDKGASVAVTYCRADTSKGEWDKLIATPAAAGQAPPPVELKEFRFADGTGSVGLPEGWTTQAQSCMSCVEIKGPAGQEVFLGMTLTAVTPTSTAVRLQQQLVMQARQLGAPPPPPMQLLVAPMAGPVDSLINLTPQVSYFSQKLGGPAIRLDRIIKQEPTKAIGQNGRAALVTYDLTRMTRGVPEPRRDAAMIEVDPISQESFMYYAIQGVAPVATFDRDLPVMVAIASSWRTNDQVVQAKTAQAIDAQNQRFAAQQAAHQEVVAAFDRYNKGWWENQRRQSRSLADFDEAIRGYRTVEDTTTGYKTSVDLGHVTEIVDRLNKFEPGRYKEIPLRDEMYPLPEGKR